MASPGEEPVGKNATDPQPFAIVFTQQPASVTVCENSMVAFNVVATGNGILNYQWQVSTDGGSTWTGLSNDATYNGTATANLRINNVPTVFSSYLYRCVVSDGSSIASSSALLTVNAAPTVQSANIAVQVCINGSATVTAATYAGLNYQWQVNTGAGFTNVINGGVYTGATSSMLRISGAPASMEGYLYRYLATNTTSGCTSTSGLDTLHVLPYATITQQPVSATVCPGFDTSFTIEATGVASVKWQVSTNGSVWTDVPDNTFYSGTTTTTLKITGVSLTMNNYRYRAVLYNPLSCPVSSSMVFLFVRSVTNISLQPVNTTVCATNTASFRVAATGSTLSYQWQTDNGSNGASWTNITPGGNSSVLNVTNVPMSMNGYRFRALVNGYCGSIISSEAVLQTQRGTWLGVTNTDWHTASNWCGGVPDNTTDVLIPAGVPNMPDIISGIGYAKSLTIEQNAKLTISGGAAQMSGPFSILGTVAYTGVSDQPVLPAAHGSLEIDGSGNKYLQTSTDVYHDLVLNGTAKLITSNYLLTMKTGSNPITGSDLTNTSASWIVTGNGSAGAANTGLGGLQYEAIRPQDGSVVFPVGPTNAVYNPLLLQNKGIGDRFTVTVNDHPIPGSFAGRTINCTWKVSEGTPGGSTVSLDLKWNKSEEQPLFDSNNVMMVRSASSMIVETQNVLKSNRPLSRVSASDFSTLTEFSLHTYVAGDGVPLAVKLTSFTAEKLNTTAALLNWSVENTIAAQYFVVQKSSFRDKGFAAIDSQSAVQGKNQYRFVDDKFGGINYYRLKTVNRNGVTQFSSTIKLINDQNGSNFQLRPSITSSSTNLFFSLKMRDHLIISLNNAAGQLQWAKQMDAPSGNGMLPIDLSTLSKGIYFINISGNDQLLHRLTLVRQ